MKIITRSNTYLEFLWETTPSNASLLRRRLLTETSCLAIRRTNYLINTSQLFPIEYIDQRIGLLSFRNKSAIRLSRTIDIEKLDSYMTVTLHVKCKDVAGAKRIVTSSDIICPPGCEVIYPEQPVLILGAGEELKFEAKVFLGLAKDSVYHETCTVVTFAEKQSLKFKRPVYAKEGIIKDFAEDGLFETHYNGTVKRTIKPFYGIVPAKWNKCIETTMIPCIKFCIETDGSITPLEALAQLHVEIK